MSESGKHITDQLRRGMSMDEVRELLRRWRESLPSAVLSPDKTHLFYTVEFTPPAGSPGLPLRLTFDNGKLFVWGEPADPNNHNIGPAAAG
jgi:hypothetical protein